MAAEIKEENLSLALRFIVEKFGKDALKEEVESLYMYLGKNESIKKCIIDEVEMGVNQ